MTSKIEAAESLYPLLREEAEEIERSRRLTPNVFEALHGIDAFRLQLGERYGGLALDPFDYLRVVEALSRGDASSGWCAMVGSESSACVNAFLAPNVVQSMIVDNPEAIVAFTVVGGGTAEKCSDSYLASGRWRFASGCRHATWLSSMCVVYESGKPVLRENGAPLTRIVFARAADAIIHDTWDVSGLRGTASDDFELDQVLIPNEHTFDFTGPALDSSPAWRIPVALRLAMSKAAAVCGIARGAMDALLPMLERKPFAGAVPAKEEPRIHVTLAEAEASLEAGRAFLYRNVERAWKRVQNEHTLSLSDIADTRLAIVWSARQALNSLHLMQEMAGTGAVFDEAFDRSARDLGVARHHMQLQSHIVEDVGRVLVGFEPRNPMF